MSGSSIEEKPEIDPEEIPSEDYEQSQAEKTQPGERLRRLLSASEEESSLPLDLDDDSYRHPTGKPDATGGWYSELEDSEIDQDDEKLRHPTGQPELTGGWYGEVENEKREDKGEELPEDARDSFMESTSPTQSDTQSVSDQPEGDDITIPPAQNEPKRYDLPKRVDEVDKFATRVSPYAFSPTSRTSKPPRSSGRTRATKTNVSKPDPRHQKTISGTDLRTTFSCLLRLTIGFIFLSIFILVIFASIGLYQYYSITASLPEIDDLSQHALQFETTRIFDRNGNELYEVIDPNAGWRTYVPLENISPFVIAATIATEDKEFYNHPGYDLVAMFRALWQNYTNQVIVSGASTITQQLARGLLFSPLERGERTVNRKAREIVLAAEITRRYTKEEILELYLNENYYGNMAYGIEAGAETYFKTTADALTISQAAFLAGLPQAPSVYDIYTNTEETLRRHDVVVVLMYELSQEKGCIYVSNSIQAVCVDAGRATQAIQEIHSYQFEADKHIMRYPHWVNYVRMLLEEQFDAQTIYRSGFSVYTTIDPDLQVVAEQLISQQIRDLQDRNVTGGALIAIHPPTGEILAMVGSPDFYNEANSGQVNMSISPRQPGSAIKPLTYLAAFEKGWTPATLIWDVPTDFSPSGDPNDLRPPYQPKNYDDRFHGPVTVRAALANSYNLPAVKTLKFVGIYDDPNTPEADGFINLAQRIGITTLTQSDYGLSLTLGGGEVTLLELTNAYATFANGGRRISAIAISKIVDREGNIVYEYFPPIGDQVFRAEHAYLISSILSDEVAREAMFGSNSVLNLPFQAAVKTGTTNDFRDNWTIGYTPDLAVGVWVGNPNYTPMQNTTGLTGAAPVWSQFMQTAISYVTGGQLAPFVQPAGVIDQIICSLSGTQPSEWCPSQNREIFAFDQLPLPKENDFWQKVEIDTWTGYKASPQCLDYVSEEFALNVSDSWAVSWILDTAQGRDWASNIGFTEPIFFTPSRECQIDDPRPNILFAGLQEDQTITENPFDIYALVSATDNFESYRLEFGLGDDPVDWQILVEEATTQHDPPERIYTWDLSEVPVGRITLRIYMTGTGETFAEKRIHLDIQVLTPTPTITPTPTLTVTLTITPTITTTPTVTEISTATFTPTETIEPIPSETPTPTLTNTPE